jgi:uncharacterized RDD family membrane protein YckC
MTVQGADMVADITSPEHVSFVFPLAGPASRSSAFFVDIAIILLPLLLYTAIQRVTLGSYGIIGLAVLLQFPYFTLWEVLWNGQTPGKRLCRLRVVSDDGLPINWQQVVIRNLLRPVDQFPALYALGVLVMMMGSRWQRIGDLAAGTLVVLEHASTELPPAKGKAANHVPTCVLRNPEMRRTVLLYGAKRNRLGKALALELVKPLIEALVKAGAMKADYDADSALMAWYHWLSTEAESP